MKLTETLKRRIDAFFRNLTNEEMEYLTEKYFNKHEKAINYNRCSLQLKDKKTVTFEDWLYKHQIKKIDRLYFAKDGTEQDFNDLHRRYVESLINL